MNLTSAVSLGSPWLNSTIIQQLHCRTTVLKDLLPNTTVTEALNEILPKLINNSPIGHPATYHSTHIILLKLAESIDLIGVEASKHAAAFFPAPGVIPNRNSARVLQRFELRLALLDTFLFILFPSTRLPPHSLQSAQLPTGLTPTCPPKSGIHSKALWILGTISTCGTTVDSVLEKMIEMDSSLANPVEATGVPGTTEHNSQVASILDQAVEFHAGAARVHAYCHQFGLLAQGVWGLVAKDSKRATRTDHADKMLDLATSTSIIVPMLRQFFQPKVTWAHNEMSVDNAAKALDNSAFRLSSPALVQFEELLYFSVLNMIEQVHSHTSQRPVPDIRQLRQWVTESFPNYPDHWSWPARQPLALSTGAVPDLVTGSSTLVLPPQKAIKSAGLDEGSSITHVQYPNPSPEEETGPSFCHKAVSQPPISVIYLPEFNLIMVVPSLTNIHHNAIVTPQLMIEGPPQVVHAEELHQPPPMPTPLASHLLISASVGSLEDMSLDEVNDTACPATSDMPLHQAGQELDQMILEALGLEDPQSGQAGSLQGPANELPDDLTVPNVTGSQLASLLDELDGLIPISPRTTPVPSPDLDSILGKRQRSNSIQPPGDESGVAGQHKRARAEQNETSGTGDMPIDLTSINPFGGNSPLTTPPSSPKLPSVPNSSAPTHYPTTSGKRLPLHYYTQDQLDSDDEEALSNFSVDELDFEHIDDMFEDAKACGFLIMSCSKPALGLSHDMELFMAVLDKAVAQSKGVPMHGCSTLYINSGDVFTTSLDLSAEFSRRNILVLPSDTEVKACRRWQDQNGRITLSSMIDPSTVVEVHDLSYSNMFAGEHHKAIRQGKISRILGHIYDDHGRVLNILNLHDSTHSTSQPPILSVLSNQTTAFNSTSHLKKNFPVFPTSFTEFNLLSGPGAITRDHVDASAGCTWIHMDSGSKLWLTMVCPINPASDVLAPTGAWSDDPWGAHVSDIDFLLKNYIWEAHHLTPGSTFIMRPHTVHLVLTLEPSLCHGGQFYASSTMMRTFHGRRLENLHCETLTNTSNPESWLILQRMLLFAHLKIILEHDVSPYPQDTLAALVLMCKYQGAFTAQTEKPLDSYGYRLQKRLSMKAATALEEWADIKERVGELKDRLVEWQQYLHHECTDNQGHYVPAGKTWKQLICGVDREEELE
ncbi:hypothetical protein RhiJN_23286 [Ceratobasidium sp. AG-Ba]|nr:hypothetical protein RhiJN_23286 [Ceratobasidium sp. AG-Ba]